MKLKPMYKFYATILDAYQRYLDSESPDSLQELIDRINRKPFVSEPAEKGTAFNEIVDLGIQGRLPSHLLSGENVVHGKFSFPVRIVSEFVNKFQGSLSQVRTEAILETSKGDVLLYGYVDELLAFKASDIKTTGQYEYPKFSRNWQHKVYCYTLRKNNTMVDLFEYAVTDFHQVWNEEYVWNEKYVGELRNICERFIVFLESQRSVITDKQIFGGEKA